MQETTISLPGEDERVRCSAFAKAAGVDPVGTAIRADLFVAVDVPLPWPKPVFAHPLLVGLDTAAKSAKHPTRVLASVPVDSKALRVVSYSRPGGARDIVRRSERTADETSVFAVVRELVEGDLPDEADRQAIDAAVERTDEVWICTQGSHDTCCGSAGTRLAADLEAHMPDLTVRRVSHTGGHRFAPTAVTLPDGRMWADLDIALIDAILERRQTPETLAPHCRGWWGAETGAAQAAERAVWSEIGWRWQPRSSDLLLESDSSSIYRVVGNDGASAQSFDVAVRPGRSVPGVTCGAAGGLPVKMYTEWVVDGISQSDGQD